MVSIGGSVFYRPKDKQVFADNAHKNFSRGNVGDHIALLNVFDQWAETNFSTQWCFENYVQVKNGMVGKAWYRALIRVDLGGREILERYSLMI